MTTQYEITRSDITADESQNHEHKIERINYRGHWITVYPYRDYDGTWLKDCAIDGEFSQCEGVAARGNLTVEQAKQIIDEITFEDEPAPAKPARTWVMRRGTDKIGIYDDTDCIAVVQGFDREVNAKLIAAAPETAAGRDRLEGELKHLGECYDKATADLKRERLQALRERDQARAQVQTLLAALKQAASFSFSDAAMDGYQPALQAFVKVKRRMRSAIASVESEGQ